MIRKKILFIALSLSIILTSYSQTGYFPINGYTVGEGTDIVNGNDGNIMIAFLALSDNYHALAKHRFTGDSIWMHIATDPDMICGYFPKIIPVSGSGYYVLDKDILFHYSEDGLLIDHHKFTGAETGDEYFASFTYGYCDGVNFHLFELVAEAGYYDYRIVVVDPGYNVLSSTLYSTGLTNFSMILFNHNGDYDYISQGYHNDALEDVSIFSIRNSESGDLIYSDTLTNVVVYELNIAGDGILCTAKTSGVSYNQLTPLFIKRNFTGEIEWTNEPSFNIIPDVMPGPNASEYITKTLIQPSGNILAVTSIANWGFDTSAYFLAQFTPEGDSLSVNYIFNRITGGYTYPGVITATLLHDNQIAYTGGAYNNLNGLPFLLLTDTLGNYYDYYVSGKLYDDLNDNGSYDAGEATIQHEIVSTSPIPYYAVSDENGDYLLRLGMEGDFTINPPHSDAWDIADPDLYSIAFDTSMNGDVLGGYDFEYDYSTPVHQVAVTVYQGPVVPGFESYNTMTIQNTGNQYDESGIADLHFPSILLDPLGSPDFDLLNDTTITWNFSGLDPFETELYHVNYITDNDLSMVNSDILTIGNVSSGAFPANADTVITTVIGSYDPNHKSVAPTGVGDDGLIHFTTEYLTYTIEFQNTGTAPTSFVHIYDTLSNLLEMESIEMLSASANYDLYLTAPNILHWEFDPLVLPDSATDLTGSMGYLKFRIKIKDDAQINDVIENEAYIYFDYNPPIVTNTTKNTLTDFDNIESVQAIPQPEIYPNPASQYCTINLPFDLETKSEFVITDINGRILFSGEIGEHINSLTIDVSVLPAGNYLCYVKAGNTIFSKTKLAVVN